MPSTGRLALRDILYVLFREKWRILGIVLIALLGAGAYLSIADPVYVAEGRVLIRVGKEKLSGLEPYAKDNYNILFQERGQDIHNAVELLRDESIARKVLEGLRPALEAPPAPSPHSWFGRAKQVARELLQTVKAGVDDLLHVLGLKVRYSQEDALLNALRGALLVEAIEDTDMLRVRFGWTDPAFAALALNTFSREFVAEYVRLNRNETSESFYQDQIREKKAVLDAAERALTAFRVTHGVGNLQLQKELLLKDMAAIEGLIRDTTLRKARYEALAAELRKARARGSEWIQTPDFPERATLDLSLLDKQYLELVAQRAVLATTHAPGSRDMQLLRERIAALRDQKARSLLTHFELNARALGAERSTIATKLAALRQRLAELNGFEIELAELERLRKAHEQEYTTYQKKAEELRISDRLNDQLISGVRVIGEARPPAAPAAPRRALILGIALAVGLFFGIGYAAIREYFDSTFRSADDVRRSLGADLLLTIPRYAARGAR